MVEGEKGESREGASSSVQLQSRCSPPPSRFLLTTMQCNALAPHLCICAVPCISSTIHVHLVLGYLGTCSEVHMGACSTCGLEPDVALRRHVSEEPVCGNYPTYVARQQFVPYCPNYLLFAMWISSGQWSSINLFFGPVLLQCF